MIRCVVYRNLLTAAILADQAPGWPLHSHTGQCIRCQAHVASLRATRRRLAELEHESVAVPPGFEARVMNTLESRLRPPSPPARWLRAAGASMAAALLAAFWMRRRALTRT